MNSRRANLKRCLRREGEDAFERGEMRSTYPKDLHGDECFWLRGWDEAEQARDRSIAPDDSLARIILEMREYEISPADVVGEIRGWADRLEKLP